MFFVIVTNQHNIAVQCPWHLISADNTLPQSRTR